MSKRNLNILITGATSGIGEALSLHYAKTSAKTLFICGRNEARLKIITNKCENLGATVISSVLDVTNRQTTKDWIESCDNTAKLNIIIANAGVASMEEVPANIYNTFDVNVYGVLNTIIPSVELYKDRNKMQDAGNTNLDQLIKKMKSQKKAFNVSPTTKKFLSKKGSEFFDQDLKSIVIISSIAGYHGLPSCPSYSASKACVKAYGEGLRGSLKSENINVTVVCPGFVRSRITDQNTCSMPFFMEADKAAKIIAKGIEKNKAIISFPWQMRFVSWLISTLPNKISEIIYNRLPNKA